MGQRLLDVRAVGVRPRRLAMAAAAVVAVAVGVVAVAALRAPSGGGNTPRADPAQLQGISSQALAQFGVRLEDPAGRGAARLTADQARQVALPLGDGPQSHGWSIVGSPVLAFADYAGAATIRTCLCWAVELNSAQGIPCDIPTAAATPGVDQLCNDHRLVELIDAASGARWLSFSGHGLG